MKPIAKLGVSLLLCYVQAKLAAGERASADAAAEQGHQGAHRKRRIFSLGNLLAANCVIRFVALGAS